MTLLACFVLCVAVSLVLGEPARAAESTDIRITHQPGLVYLQAFIMADKKLVEKHAAAMGLAGVNVRWSISTSGGAITDAILSDSIDVAATGISNMLLAWGKTNGQIKSITGIAGVPYRMLTRNPDVKTVKDFGENDRIAVPTVGVSVQAMILGIALERAWGPGQHGKLNSNQVQLGHPDALQALLNPRGTVNSHFSIPPFQEIEMKSPLVHTVFISTDVMGGPVTITNSWAKQSFVSANPIKTKAFIAAEDEANELVSKDPKTAAEIYLRATKEKITIDELVELIQQPGAIFSTTPQRTLIWAEYMARVGLINRSPTSWKDFTFPMIHDRDGS